MDEHSKAREREVEGRFTALQITVAYVILGAVWILFSDLILGAASAGTEQLTRLQTLKGWVFVLGTGLLLYLLVRMGARRIQRLEIRRAYNMDRIRETERELTETQRVLSTLQRNIPGMAYRCRNDPQWTMEFVGDGCQELTGHSAEDLVGNRGLAYADLIHRSDRDRVWDEVQAALGSGRPFQLTYRVITAGGETKWVWEQGCGVYDEDGELAALEGYITDITEQKELELQLFQAQKLESVGRLAGSIAHDFNNVLTAVSGYAELLLRDFDPEDRRREDTEEIVKASRRAAALTGQLLSFTRRGERQESVLVANEAIEQLGGMLRRLLGEDIELRLNLDPGLALVRIDLTQLQQILMNLVVNARDAMPDGGTLTVDTSNMDLDDRYVSDHEGVRAGPYVMIAVSDTGVGMAGETQDRVFEPFFTTKGPGKGTGLGLSTAYSIVKENAGNIWVYSTPGEGTVFKIYLPQVDEEGRALTPQPEREPAPRGHEMVLVVEDEEGLRVLLREFLERAGYEVMSARDGLEALDLLKGGDQRPDLVISDLVLPGITGQELVGRVRRQYPDIKVIYMSGYTHLSDPRPDLRDETAAFLVKPFSSRALLGKVRHVLDEPNGTHAA